MPKRTCICSFKGMMLPENKIFPKRILSYYSVNNFKDIMMETANTNQNLNVPVTFD